MVAFDVRATRRWSVPDGIDGTNAYRRDSAAARNSVLKLFVSTVDIRFMRQCPTCRRIYPKALGRGIYCSADCELSQLRRIRSAVRLRRLARIVNG